VPHDLAAGRKVRKGEERKAGQAKREKEQKVRGTFRAVKTVLQIFFKICLKNIFTSFKSRIKWIFSILPTALWPWGSTQPLTEMSTRNLPGGKKRPAPKAHNLTVVCEPIV
jgi:hypothetical protein